MKKRLPRKKKKALKKEVKRCMNDTDYFFKKYCVIKTKTDEYKRQQQRDMEKACSLVSPTTEEVQF